MMIENTEAALTTDRILFVSSLALPCHEDEINFYSCLFLPTDSDLALKLTKPPPTT